MASLCRAHLAKTETKFPVKLPKAQKRVEEKTVFLLSCDGKTALCKREEAGILAGLWQFPNCAGSLTAEEAIQYLSEQGVAVTELIKEVRRVHIFTHVRWEMTAYRLQCSSCAGSFIWAERDEIEEKFALPTAFKMFLQDL